MSRLPPARRILRLDRVLAAICTVVMSACSGEIVSVLPVSAVEIQPAHLALMEGESGTLSVVLRGSGGEVLAGRPISWSSDAEDIASVDESGRVTAGTRGETVIRGTSEGVEGTADVLVLGGPTIQLSEELLEFQGISGQGDPLERQVGIVNAQGGTLSGLSVVSEQDPGAPAAWLQATLVGASAPTTVVVTAQASGLPAGSYSGEVRVESLVAENSPQIIMVVLEVSDAPPELLLDPSAVALSGVTGDVEPASLSVDVLNAGSGSLTSLATSVEYVGGDPPNDWLEATLDSTEAPTTLVLRASPRMLDPGTYRAVVQVSSPDAENESASVEVMFNVSPR